MNSLKLIFVFVIFLFYSENIFASEQLQSHPVGWNCAQWNSMDKLGADQELLKILFIKGIYTGLIFGQSPNVQYYFGPGPNMMEATDVDEFCKDELNNHIPVVFSLMISAAKRNGNDEKVISRLVTKIRQEFKK